MEYETYNLENIHSRNGCSQRAAQIARLESPINEANLFESRGSLPTFEAVWDRSRAHTWHAGEIPSAEQNGVFSGRKKMTPFACQPDSPIRKKKTSTKFPPNEIACRSLPLKSEPTPHVYICILSYIKGKLQAQNMGGYEGYLKA